jgi:hypothetical protein
MRCKTATASTFASTNSRSSRPRARAALAALLALLAATGAAHAATLADMRGHLGLGYAKLMNQGAPGGSLGIGAGVEMSVLSDMDLGAELGFDLLGGNTHERGSVSADLDYSLIEGLLLLHWMPARGPFNRVSLGPGIFHARAALSTGAPALFQDLPVDETAPGMGGGLEFGPKGKKTVKAGVEVAARAVWLEHETWTVGLARLVVHY